MTAFPVRRRPLLATALYAACAPSGGASPIGNIGAVAPPGPGAFAALAPWLDVLIPADETPSASALGIDTAMLRWAQQTPKALRLLTDGCRWLDQASRQNAGVPFAELPVAARNAVARFAEAAGPTTLERVFFVRSWELARLFYYADPRSWPDLGFDGPPQPIGFPAAARPPRNRSR